MSNQNMIVAGVEIREQDGLYSLTDLHKASGGNDKNRPSRWLRRQRTKALISKLNNDLSAVIKSDKKAGTFACTEAVIAYAMSVAPVFEVEVIREYLKTAQKKLRQAQLQGSAEWHKNREQGKTQRKQLTDEIKRLVEYATANGSKSGERYFMSITRMIDNACSIESRDDATPDQLAVLAIAEIVAERELRFGLSTRTEYHQLYKDVKAAVFSQVLKLPEVQGYDET